MKTSTDGRCPKCGSYQVGLLPSPALARCLDCAEAYIRLTGGEALRWRKAHPDDDGIFVEKADKCTAKPPIGVIPKQLWMEKRAQDLARSIHEYIAEGRYALVGEWLIELHELWPHIAERPNPTNPNQP